jgi:hypothetical protein
MSNIKFPFLQSLQLYRRARAPRIAPKTPPAPTLNPAAPALLAVVVAPAAVALAVPDGAVVIVLLAAIVPALEAAEVLEVTAALEVDTARVIVVASPPPSAVHPRPTALEISAGRGIVGQAAL